MGPLKKIIPTLTAADAPGRNGRRGIYFVELIEGTGRSSKSGSLFIELRYGRRHGAGSMEVFYCGCNSSDKKTSIDT